jgi:hypothetical protein
MPEYNDFNISETESALLTASSRDVIKTLVEEKSALSIRMKVCDHYLKSEDSIVQIHVIAIRDESAFLEDFTTEVMTGYRPKETA